MRASIRGVAVATLFVALTLPTVPAAAASGSAAKPHKSETVEHALVHWINVQRVKHGLRPLTPAADLTRVAHLHTEAMIAHGKVWHDPRVGHEVTGWLRLGEDVGRTGSLASMEYALLNTKANRVNILGAEFRDVGVGTGGRRGLLYVTVLVRQPTPAKHH